MNIIIVGNGKVGYTLAQYLSKDGHDITILDTSQHALNKASETLDVMCVRGNGANVKTLIEASVEPTSSPGTFAVSFREGNCGRLIRFALASRSAVRRMQKIRNEMKSYQNR